MTRNSRPAANRRQALHTSRTKTPSAQLTRLDIEAEDCPQVLLRVLGLVARDSTIPVTIEASRQPDGIVIALELDGLTAQASELVAHRIAGFPTVRKVSVAGPTIA